MHPLQSIHAVVDALRPRPTQVRLGLCRFLPWPLVLAFLLGATPAWGGPATQPLPPVPEEAVEENPPLWVTPSLDLRLRYEYGDQSDLRAANAATARARVGVLTRAAAGFQAFAEYEGTVAADRTSYQAASVHGLGEGRTVIADPESHELNQLWLSWSGAGLDIKGGRQAINRGNQRHVGGVAWRQNMQTFDAATLGYAVNDDLSLYYGYVRRVNRIFGSGDKALAAQDDFAGDSHLIEATWNSAPFGTLTAYAYLLDLNNGGGAFGTRTYGLWWQGSVPVSAYGGGMTAGWYLEGALQEGAFGNPNDHLAPYIHAAVSLSKDKGPELTLGYELLGSDPGRGAVQFPLGTGHRFNGYADLFLTTPANGLQDMYVRLVSPLPLGLRGELAGHRFLAARGGGAYGSELDAVLSRRFGNHVTALAKHAWFFGENSMPDVQRFSIELNVSF